jgi:putative FmdB family regulatory protein
MPLYDYRCTKCGTITEVRRGFDETFSQACAACGGAVQRVFNPAPIVFKGSGFYKTDSRKSDAPKDSAPKSDAPKSDAQKADSPKSDTPKPDAPKSDTPSGSDSAV